ncbi:hypothetical protein THSYN_29180 (plasmid) [Candidatus Thiodictyon syntrophicum]|jgi:hypothetical protein|uniref:Uncharacterized protein n=2 Tax=Candidatus Thiodictyon syntrophicum TaxID=1166950 RepID=A0A2K8UHF4_9GAMM|nr:hypothetical protein THSYN_29180 [Candidatus Thiodictyon syntrophicum]
MVRFMDDAAVAATASTFAEESDNNTRQADNVAVLLAELVGVRRSASFNQDKPGCRALIIVPAGGRLLESKASALVLYIQG